MNRRDAKRTSPPPPGEEAEREFDRLLALHETGLLDPPAPPELAAICEEARARFGVAAALVTLVDRDRLVIPVDGEALPRDVAFCDWTIQADDVFVVPDLSRDPRFQGNPLVVGEPFHRFYAGAPLIYLDGIRLGSLCLLDPSARDFSLGERAELAAMADQVVAVIADREFPPAADLAVR
jgi:GAF domain-containing protein